MNTAHVISEPDNSAFLKASHALIRNSIRLSQLADDQLKDAFAKLSPEAQVQILEALKPMLQEDLFEQASINGREFVEQDERQRDPFVNEPQVVHPEEILILSKKSRVEIDSQAFKLSEGDLLELYRKNGESNTDKIFAAHKDHIKARADLEYAIPEATWTNVWELQKQELIGLLDNSKYKLLLVLGGDDTLKLIGPYIQDQYVVLCNSNAVQSNGVMANFDNNNISAFLPEVLSGNFVIEDWSKLEATIYLANGEQIKTRPAINEIGIQDRNYNLTGRCEVLEMGRVKGTGALIATGAGVTGWFSSASKYRYPNGRSFSKTAARAELCVREPYGEEDDFSKEFTHISGSEILTMISTSNNNLELCIDSQTDLIYPLPRGSRVEVKLSEKPLKIINLKRE